MAKTIKFVDHEHWREFKNSCARFMRSIDPVFMSEKAQHIFPDKNSSREGFYSIPMVAMMISLGFENLDTLNNIEHTIGEKKVEKIYFYFLSLQIDRDKILTTVMGNWSKCPPILRELFQKYNPSLHFANSPYNPDIKNMEDEFECESTFQDDTPVNLTQWDVAFSKFILQYMDEFKGLKSNLDIKAHFVNGQCNNHFLLNGRAQKVNGTQFTAHCNLVKKYALKNKTLFDFKGDRIFYNEYLVVLQGILILFPYEESVLTQFANNEMEAFKNPTSKKEKLVAPTESQIPDSSKPDHDLNVGIPKNYIEAKQRQLNEESPDQNLKPSKALTQLEIGIVDILAESIQLDKTQVRLLKETLTSMPVLEYFLSKL